MAVYQYKIGSSYATLTNLEELSTPVFAPRHSLLTYSKPTRLGNGAIQGIGWIQTEWYWDFLTQAQYTMLKSFCSGLSADVYINTRKNSGTYQVYAAKMLWPQKEPEFTNDKVLSFTLQFIQLVEYTP